jgi:hypothetical protein
VSHESNPFDQAQDPEIRALLLGQLEGAAPERFIDRVIAGLPERASPSSWEVLARWARMGTAAAAVITLALGAWLATPRPSEPVREPLLELGRTADSELLMTAMISEP